MDKAIIVADDSMIIRNIIEKALSDQYVVLKASNGKEALKHITDKKYEIVGILLDLNMPESDGFTVLNYFKNNNLFKKYPIVIISGDDTSETINKAFTYDIVDMLNKPFTGDKIKSMVERMISLRG
jgi:putative two-component system response regulator